MASCSFRDAGAGVFKIARAFPISANINTARAPFVAKKRLFQTRPFTEEH
jgi:hypothetical protein